MSGLGVRFAALVCLFVFLGGKSSANVLYRIPSKTETAKTLAESLPFLANHAPVIQDAYASNRKGYDVVFIIDDSGSITHDQFNEGLKALRSLIEASDWDTTFAAIKYSNTAQVLFNFVSRHQAMMNLANVHKIDGLTNTQAALKMAREDLFMNSASSGHRPGAVRIAVLVTDGNSNVKEHQTVPQATLLKAIGTEVFVIAVGNYGTSGLQEMKNIASSPYQKYFHRVTDFSALRLVAQYVANANTLRRKS